MWLNHSCSPLSRYIFFFLLPFVPELHLASNDLKFFDIIHGKHLNHDELELYKYYYGKCYSLTATLNYYRAMALGMDQKALSHKSPTVQAPTLILWGKDDTALIEDQSLNTVKECSNADLQFLSGSHWVQLDNHVQVNARIIKFLQDSA